MLFKKNTGLSLLTLQVIFLMACASPKTPTGGLKDELPPVIIQEESTTNQQTFFKEKKITITFDEWITLKDVYTQLVISPLMPDDPEIELKGKSIIISLPDSLKDETTYTINFGNAIADLNEGNILENFSFAFSTGAILDSIKLSGMVTDVVTLKPAEGIWVMLYPLGEDSAVYKRKPEYLAKTNKEGKWAMANIRADSFNVVALKDDNLNFLYDQETELFGWLDDIIYTSAPVDVLPEIFVFPKEKQILIREVDHKAPGWIKLVVDAPLPKPVPVLFPPLDNAVKAWSGDTLHIWYVPENNYSGIALLNNDTTEIRQSPGKSILATSLRITPQTGRLHPLATARFAAEVPIVNLDTSKIMVVRDSSGTIPFFVNIDSIDRRIFTIGAFWKVTSRNTLSFLPGAITDVWGRINDTIRQSIVVNDLDQYGDVTIDIDGLDSTKFYLLLIKSGEKELAHFVIKQLATTRLHKKGVLPGKYVIEIIEDLNGNETWDTGDFHIRRQPERRMIFQLENLRAAWDLETKLTWQ